MRMSRDLLTAFALNRSSSGAMSCMAAELDAISLLLANSSFLCSAKRCSCTRANNLRTKFRWAFINLITRPWSGNLIRTEALSCQGYRAASVWVRGLRVQGKGMVKRSHSKASVGGRKQDAINEEWRQR